MSVDQRQAAPPELPGASARSAASDNRRRPDGTAIPISEVSKAFGHGDSALLALDRVSLTVALGEFVCLVGASGCGKSTLLSLVAGLDTPTAGKIGTVGRRVALMFQEPALFPWLTAARNVELALRASGMARGHGGSGRRNCSKWCTSMGSRTSDRTSCRAACASGWRWPGRSHQDADVLLMDEPFGALDAMTRDLLHDELDRICMERGLTVLFVTHNVREAVRLGDRVVVLSSRPGRVIDEFAVPIRRAAPDRLAAGRRACCHDHRPAAGGDGAPWQADTEAVGPGRPRQPGNSSGQ